MRQQPGFLILLPLLAACSAGSGRMVAPAVTAATTVCGSLEFAAQRWNIYGSGSGPPGPYTWACDNVEYNERTQELTLYVRYRNGRWTGAQIATQNTFQYGTFAVHVKSGLDRLPDPAVFGFFTLKDDAVPHTEEIDIEFSRWGHPEADNLSTTVWPSEPVPRDSLEGVNVATRKISRRRLQQPTSHAFTWRADRIEFWSMIGSVPNEGIERSDDVLHTWSYPPPGRQAARYVPQGPARLVINFWKHPSTLQARRRGRSYKVVITGVTAP